MKVYVLCHHERHEGITVLGAFTDKNKNLMEDLIELYKNGTLTFYKGRDSLYLEVYNELGKLEANNFILK